MTYLCACLTCCILTKMQRMYHQHIGFNSVSHRLSFHKTNCCPVWKCPYYIYQIFTHLLLYVWNSKFLEIRNDKAPCNKPITTMYNVATSDKSFLASDFFGVVRGIFHCLNQLICFIVPQKGNDQFKVILVKNVIHCMMYSRHRLIEEVL